MITLREWFELDENKKDALWGNTIITYLRQHMQPVINEAHAKEGMTYLLGMHSMDEVKKMFKDPAKSGVSFLSIPFLEKIRNVFIAEMSRMGVVINVRSVDPTADEERRHDEALLKKRSSIEGLLSYIYQSIGDPKFSMSDEEKRGNKAFKGNIDEFDKMDLNSDDKEDVGWFMNNFHRLDHEIAAQEPLEFFMTYNEVDELITYWVNDILAKKAIAAKIYVSDDSGAIKYEYLAPETVYALQGRKKDYKDSSCLAYEQSVTIAEMIEIIGNDFDYDRDMMDLLRAVNYAYKTEYTGVHSDNRLYFGEVGNLCSYSQFLQFQVGLGYIEFKSINAKAYKVTDKNSFGNFSMFPTGLTSEVTADSIYRKENEYTQCTYKAYYLTISPQSQRLFKYGKLNFQYFEGAEDQISNYSIIVYKEVGKTVVEIAKPFIDFLEKNFKKFEYMVVRAKPPGRAYNYESLVKIATEMFPESNQRIGVDEVMRMFYDSANEVYTLPEINGNAVGGGSNINYDIPHGLSKSIVEFKNNIDWAFNMINTLIGISPLRDAYAPQPRETTGLQMKSLEYSENATFYIPRMIGNVIERLGTRTLYYVQDIITYKEEASVSYKFLTRALGYLTVDKLKQLGRIALHRYGIFIESFDQGKLKEKLEAALDQALVAKSITTAQYLLISCIKSPKKAFLVLAFMENRNIKIAQKNQLQLQQAQTQGLLEVEKVKQETQDKKILGEIAVENVRGEWFYKAHAYSTGAKLMQQGMNEHADVNQGANQALGALNLLNSQQQQQQQQAAPAQSGQPPMGNPSV